MYNSRMGKDDDLYKELPSRDPAKLAAAGLSEFIDEEHDLEEIEIVDEKLRARKAARNEQRDEALRAAEAAKAEMVNAQIARSEARVLSASSERANVRLLWITRDISVMEAGSLSERRMLELSTLFPEIHMVILNVRDREPVLPMRLAENVWIYPTNSRFWWKMPFDAARVAREQLAFAGGFRADVIIAEDPFEAGLAGKLTAEKYERPLQVHVLDNIYSPEFKDIDPHNAIRLYVARYVIKRADCVRTRSMTVRNHILYEHTNLQETTETLPQYHDLAAWRDVTPTFDLHDRYPQFKFIMLHISAMQAQSHTDRVIQGVARTLLQYPTVGLVVVGSGPLRAAIEKLVMTLGLQRQVVFEPYTEDVISYMKTANVLIHLSESPEEDEVVLEAAAVKLPMILPNSGLAFELFSDGEAAFLCPVDDPSCVSSRINTFLNENMTRTSFAMNAQEIVFDRIEQDYQAYLRAYQSSIERCAR